MSNIVHENISNIDMDEVEEKIKQMPQEDLYVLAKYGYMAAYIFKKEKVFNQRGMVIWTTATQQD